MPRTTTTAVRAAAVVAPPSDPPAAAPLPPAHVPRPVESPPPPAPAPAQPPAGGSPEGPPAAGPNWKHQRAKKWYVALAASVGALTLLGSCGTFAYQLVQEELEGRQAQAEVRETSAPPPRDISTREVDSEPLTVDEVFPNEEIVINPAEPPYQVIETQESDDCTVAAADALGELLTDLDCSQVVRATLRSPTEAYLITGGVFNLAAEEDAEQVYDSIGPMIDDESGRFLGLLAGEGTEPIVLSETRVGWDFLGHYLVYVVIARADGEPFAAADDRHAELILWDIVEVHLRTNVLEARTVPDATAESPPAEEPPDQETGDE